MPYRKATIFIGFLVSLFCLPAWSDLNSWQPRASDDSIVVFHQARFTVLTPQLIRLEFSSSKEFEDKASLAIVNRNLPTPAFTKNISASQLTIETQFLRLKYRDDGKPFNENNLSIELKSFNKARWNPSIVDTKNLKGTARTLDQISGWSGESKLENGIVSRSGWSVIDDSNNNLFDGDQDWNWVTERNFSEIDWYFFGYGDNYKQAIFDFTQIAGKIPMPPKYAFGYWWSRYWIYNDTEFRKLVGDIRDAKIPLDVLIIDMDWHETYGFSASRLEKDSQGEFKGWTGYTWNKNLFPNPKEFIAWTNQEYLKTALNLHPASGISTMEEKYIDFVNAYDPEKYKEHKDYVPFLMSDNKWAKSYFDVMLKPMEDWGIDFWWLDWQQFLFDKKIPSLGNTQWLNYTFFSNMEKSGKRPMIFHRWGGLGNHRYPIGFSGDAFANWETLDFETYFTATAANVGYGYWSHDIGGHINNDTPTEGELYLRWIQFGVMSPILRTHASKISINERRPWMFPQQFSAMRDAIQFRYSLAPYIYASARKAYETGVSLVHPLYYDYPKDEQAYTYKTEYFFGDQMLAAPITSPVQKKSQLAEKKIWLPQGDWFEYSSGQLLKGNEETNRFYAQNEFPLFVKAGALIVMNPPVTNLQQKPDTQIIMVVPDRFNAKKISTTSVYEDDENTSEYQQGKFAQRKISSRMTEKNKITLQIEKVSGTYQDMPQSQKFDLKLLNRGLPKRVLINDREISASTQFDVEALATTLHLGNLPNNESTRITIEFNHDLDSQNLMFNGNKGFFNRMAQVTERLKFASAKTDWGGTLNDDIYIALNVQNELRYAPEKSAELMAKLNQSKNALPKALIQLKNIPEDELKTALQFLNL